MKNNFEVNIVERDPRTLVFHPDNPRIHSDEAVAALAESIREDPLYFRGRPVLLSNRTGELVVIGGEGRTRASILLGLDTIPTVLFEGLDLEGEIRIMQKDNDHSGKWNPTKLAELAAQWGDDKIKRWSPNASGWRKELDSDSFVRTHIPELSDLGEEKKLDDILNEEGALARERVIITFPPERKGDVCALLGLDKMAKVMYRIEELEQ